jgi:hypothetical protein
MQNFMTNGPGIQVILQLLSENFRAWSEGFVNHDTEMPSGVVIFILWRVYPLLGNGAVNKVFSVGSVPRSFIGTVKTENSADYDSGKRQIRPLVRESGTDQQASTVWQ